MVDSPCQKICTLDEETGYCKGCFRTVAEVAGWLTYTDEQKQEVLECLAQRRGFVIPAKAGI